MTFKIGSRKPQTEAETKQYFDYWNDLLPTDTDFVSRAIPLAQFAHESAWSTSELAKNAHNHAGHKFKGDDGWDKKRQYIKDAEEEDEKGNKYIIPDTGWRKYNSDKEFAEHHASWLSRTPSYSKTYEKALNAKTWQEQLRALQGTYALDSKYYELVKNYIEDYDLTQYDIKRSEKVAYIGIDIGHGKNSPARGGSKGWTGDEHSFNSKVAVRTKALLEAMGHKVTFGVQNPNSNEVGLAPRTQHFNAQKVDVLISIHANAHSNTTVNGVSAFYDRYGRGRDSASLKLAKAIMDEYRKQKQVIWSTGEVPSYRGNWTDFHMNRESTMPSVLMELGFMTGNRDREYVFGSKQAQFVEDMAQGIANGVDKYFGGAGQTGSAYNPQGLKTIKIPAYKAPTNEFDKLEVGQEVTIRDPFNWYDDKNKVFMASKKEKEIIGTKDKIKAIKDINPIGYSKVAYLLEGYNSWILEQDLVEARNLAVEPDEKQDVEELQEGQFWLDDKLYQVTEIK